MFKNVASQKLTVIAFADAGHASLDAGEPVTGDAANITLKIEQDDDGSRDASNDANPTETEDGQYVFDLTQGESNGNKLSFYPQSATAGVQVVCLPSNVIYTRPPNFTAMGIESDGHVHGDVKEFLGSTPNALVGGRMDSNVGAISGDSAAADNLESYTDGTTPMPVNATQISGDATAADNLEAMLDGTGGQVLTLQQLRIAANNADGGVYITNANASGAGIKVGSGAAGNAIDATGGVSGIKSTGGFGYGLHLTSPQNNALRAETSSNTPTVYVGNTGSSVAVDLDSEGGVIIENGVYADRYNRTGNVWPAPVVIRTTIATLASQTSFTLTAGSADNDAYNGYEIRVGDNSTSTQVCRGKISDYVGSSKTVTLEADPGIFTMAVGDSVDILMPGITQAESQAGAAEALTAFGAATAGGVSTVLTAVTALAAKFTGITSVADWLRRAFRKDTGSAGMATAETEINDGVGTFDENDSLQNIKDTGGGGGAGGSLEGNWRFTTDRGSKDIEITNLD